MLPILSSIIVGHGGTPSRGRAASRWRRATRSAWRWSTRPSASLPAWPAKGLPRRCRRRGCSAPSRCCSCALAVDVRRLRTAPAGVRCQAAWRAASQRLRGGHFAGVFAMGGVSALIVEPLRRRAAGGRAGLPQPDARRHAGRHGAVRAGRRHERAAAAARRLGGCAAAASAGAWMEGVKRFFGVLLLGVAIWIVQPLLPSSLAMVGVGPAAAGRRRAAAAAFDAHAARWTWLRRDRAGSVRAR